VFLCFIPVPKAYTEFVYLQYYSCPKAFTVFLYFIFAQRASAEFLYLISVPKHSLDSCPVLYSCLKDIHWILVLNSFFKAFPGFLYFIPVPRVFSCFFYFPAPKAFTGFLYSTLVPNRFTRFLYFIPQAVTGFLHFTPVPTEYTGFLYFIPVSKAFTALCTLFRS
jgi:hypothetical protein